MSLSTVEPKLRRSHAVRQAISGGLFVGIGLMLLLTMGLRFGWMGIVATLMGPVTWGTIMLREHCLGARRLDAEGATRKDGRRFAWTDLKQIQEQRARLPSGELGAINHVDLVFAGGRVRILYFITENLAEVMKFLKELEEWITTKGTAEVRAEPARAETATADPKPVCSICSQLAEYQSGFQKGGREEEDTYLPSASGKLKNIKEVEPGKNRTPVLQQCPECGTYYLYETEYEFLVSGSEDEQKLSRLSEAEARGYLDLGKG